MAARGRKSGGGDGSKTKPQPKGEMKGESKAMVEKGATATTKGAAKGPAERPPAKRKGSAAGAELAAAPLTSPSPVGVAQLDLESPVPSSAANKAAAPSDGGQAAGSHNDNGNGNGRGHAVLEFKEQTPPPSPDERPATPHGVARISDAPEGDDGKTLNVDKPITLVALQAATKPEAADGAATAAAAITGEAPTPVAPPSVDRDTMFEAPDDPDELSTLGNMPALNRPATVVMPPPPPTPAPTERSPEAQTPSPTVPNEPPAEASRPILQPPLLFEVGWEVCWQLGGIYTVLRSKAACMLKTWGDRYCLVGPYNPVTAPVEFEPEEPDGYMAEVLRRLRESGIPCYYGHWMIAGRPRVLLLDYRGKFRDLDGDKYLMWADHGISVPNNDGELNEVVSFGFACTEFFRQLANVVTDRAIIGHFHEWMAGVAVPRIAHLRLPISTVFTTHATLLGRYLAGDNPDFYNHLPFLNPDFEAKKYMIYPRYQIEKAATHASVVFTTVSEVTAYEAEKLLGRRADAILPNGLNIQRFAALHEFQNLHRQYKEQIHEFVMGHFFPAYTFDLDKTIYLVTSGRYEYRNKGMDMFVEALYRLNQRLRYVPDRPTVVAFVITKAPVKHVNISALQSQTYFEELHRTCTELQEEMGQKLFLAAAQGKVAESKDLLGGDATVRLKRAMHAWRTGQNPGIVTHDLQDDANDPVLKHLRHRHLFNHADDPVKIVFHPQFVTQTGPLINLDYEQFVRGCHAGIFPSYYEPWGYTPMECVALGVPAVTTDLSGFGAYVRRHIPDSGDKGICVLNRRYRSFDECCNELVDYLFEFVRMSRRQRIELRNKVERLSELFDWSALARHYREAHDMALERVGAPRPGRVEIRLV